jgi:hypothetical protein
MASWISALTRGDRRHFRPVCLGLAALGSAARSPPATDRTYLLRLSDGLPDQTSAFERMKRALKRAAVRTKVAKRHGIRDWFWWRGATGAGRELDPGDTIIPVWSEGGRERVYACWTVLSTAPAISDRGAPLTIVWYAAPKGEASLP